MKLKINPNKLRHWIISRVRISFHPMTRPSDTPNVRGDCHLPSSTNITITKESYQQNTAIHFKTKYAPILKSTVLKNE